MFQLRKKTGVASNEGGNKTHESVKAQRETLKYLKKKDLKPQFSKSLTNIEQKKSMSKWLLLPYSPMKQRSQSNSSNSPTVSSCNIYQKLRKKTKVTSNEGGRKLNESVKAPWDTLKYLKKKGLKPKLSKSMTNLDQKKSLSKPYSPLKQKSQSNCNISQSLQALCVRGNDSPLSSPMSSHGLTFLGNIYTVTMGEQYKQPARSFLTKKKSVSLPCIPQEA